MTNKEPRKSEKEPCKSEKETWECENMKEVDTSSMDYELYECGICGRRNKLYYDEMR